MRGEGDVEEPVAELGGGEQRRAAGEGEVVVLEDVARGGAGGDNQRVDGAEAEVHEWAVLGGKHGEGEVGGGAAAALSWCRFLMNGRGPGGAWLCIGDLFLRRVDSRGGEGRAEESRQRSRRSE